MSEALSILSALNMLYPYPRLKVLDSSQGVLAAARETAPA